MKYLPGLLLLGVAASCRPESTPEQSRVAAQPTNAVNNAARDDSLLAGLSTGQLTVTTGSDTISIMGGGMLSDNYRVLAYQRNQARYLRVTTLRGGSPNSENATRVPLRVPFPAMESSHRLLTSPSCGIDDKRDPNVIAIVALNLNTIDSVYRDIRHAWRFDRATETLAEIPTRGVVCWNDVDE